MKTERNKKLLALMASYLMAFLTLGACQPSKETVIVNAAPVPTETLGGKASQGGVDGGGENGYNGRPLESYRIVDTQSINEIRESINPIIHNLSRSFIPLAADLTFILQERAWYLIPAPLDQIPAYKLGVYFPTDQLAIQNFSEIWIDSKHFNAMTSRDRATLLLHELVMGVRLLEGAGTLDRCIANATIGALDGTSTATYQGRRNSCYQNYGAGQAIIVPEIRIEKEDVEHIRALTTKLQASQGTLDGDELKAWLKATKLRVYDAP